MPIINKQSTRRLRFPPSLKRWSLPPHPFLSDSQLLQKTRRENLSAEWSRQHWWKLSIWKLNWYFDKSQTSCFATACQIYFSNSALYNGNAASDKHCLKMAGIRSAQSLRRHFELPSLSACAPAADAVLKEIDAVFALALKLHRFDKRQSRNYSMQNYSSKLRRIYSGYMALS